MACSCVLMICACLYDVYDDGDEVYVQRTTYIIITRVLVRVGVDCMPINCDMTCTEWVCIILSLSYKLRSLIFCCVVLMLIPLALMEGVRLLTH